MFISVFIPTGKRVDSLRNMLESLKKQTYKNFEVVIVDYKSDENLTNLVEDYNKQLQIKVVHQNEKGLSRAANLALENAVGEIFIRTDDDVIAGPGWLEAVNETFENDAKIGGVTGPTVIPDDHLKNRDLFVFEEKFRKGGLFWKLLGRLYFQVFMEGQPRRVSHWFKSGAFSLGSNYKESLNEPFQEVDNLEACNLSVRTDLLRKVGGFDSIYTGVGEYHEADAVLKIRDLGYKLVFNPKAAINHCPSQDGFFNDRPNSYSRMLNFIIFHTRFIKIDTLSALFRYVSYLLFLNAFYIYVAVLHKQSQQLMAIPGTIVGLIRTITNKNYRSYAKS